MLKKILVPVDGSTRAEAVLGQLRALLEGLQTEVLVLRAAYVPTSLRGVDYTTLLAERAAEAGEYVKNLAGRLHQMGIRARGIVRKHYPAGAILDAAADEGVGLIAMSSHGGSGANQGTFGSIAQKILLASHIPVLVLRSFVAVNGGKPVPTGTREFCPKRILLPTDGSRLSLAVVPAAAELARRFGSEIIALHVREAAPKRVTVPADAARVRPRGAQDAATAACGSFAQVHVKATPVLADGDPATRILELSRSLDAGLIAMATHGSDAGMPSPSLGSVTQRVLRGSRLPMLIVRPDGDPSF